MTDKIGKLIGLSLGPGDPGLITKLAWDTLQGDALWTYPVKKAGAESYALEIVKRAGFSVPESALALTFPMTHNKDVLSRAWAEAARQVVEVLVSGRDVLFLVEGDASTYSTFQHLARATKQLSKSAEIETIAGVSSFNAAAARLGVPLTDVDDCMAVIPAGYGVEKIKRLLSDFDSVVLMKVKPVLDEVLELLEELGLTEHALFIERAGTPEERIVRDVGNLKGEKVHYLSLMLLKNPNREKEDLKKGCKLKG